MPIKDRLTSFRYRLVDGDLCDPYQGLNLLPLQVPCPEPSTTTTSDNGNSKSPTKHSSIGIIVGVLTGGAILTCAVTLFLLLRNNPKYVLVNSLSLTILKCPYSSGNQVAG